MQQEEEVLYAAGTVIRDRYVVEKFLGKDGFDSVYLVKDLADHDNRVVAPLAGARFERDARLQGQELYILKERLHSHKQERERFIFEGIVLKQLNHPALPQVYRIFEDDKQQQACMLMRYISGPDLETLRQQRPTKRFPLPALLSLIAPVVQAISYLHQHQPPVIHRNIAPVNIVVPTENDAVLVNFGIDQAGNSGACFPVDQPGIPGYCAPEYYAGTTNIRTDIYALGATIYTLLTGLIPPDARDRVARVANLEIDPLVKANQFTLTVPAAIAETLQRAMSLNSAERFSSAEEFWQALNSYGIRQQSRDIVFLPLVSTPLPTEREEENPHPVKTHFRLSGLPRVAVLLLMGFVMIMTLSIGATLWSYAVGEHNGTASPAVPLAGNTVTHITAISTVFPQLASTYRGTIHNIPANLTTTLSLSGIVQSQGDFNGTLTMGKMLQGNGLFRGMIQVRRHLVFTVIDERDVSILSFEGSIQADGNMGGSYCRLNTSGQCTDEYGVWSAAPY